MGTKNKKGFKNFFNNIFDNSLFNNENKKRYFNSEYISDVISYTSIGKTEISINGKTIDVEDSGDNSVKIENGKVFINGKEIQDIEMEETKNINITINGNCEKVKSTGDITINGDCENAKSENGDITIKGNVKGSIISQNGDVEVEGEVGGSITTQNGDIIKG